MKKSILDDEYLYGSDVEVPEIPRDIIMRRIEILRDNLEKLLNHSYHIRDNDRVRAILKAISFWGKIK